MLSAAAQAGPVDDYQGIFEQLARGHPAGHINAASGDAVVEVRDGKSISRLERFTENIGGPVCVLILQSGIGLGRTTLADTDCDGTVEVVKFDDDQAMAPPTAHFDRVHAEALRDIANALQETAGQNTP
ncbi:MAG: hypothetical protein AAFX00_06575 [Pseudomonadota bacterium]